jgi:GNS1/SUR4 family
MAQTTRAASALARAVARAVAGPAARASYLLPQTFEWRGSPASGVYYPVVAIAVYLPTIFGLQRFMRDKPPLALTTAAFAHNVFLCLLSAAMCAGSLVELRSIYARGGVAALMCDRDRTAVTGRLGLWMYIFYISKVRPHILHCFRARMLSESQSFMGGFGYFVMRMAPPTQVAPHSLTLGSYVVYPLKLVLCSFSPRRDLSSFTSCLTQSSWFSKSASSTSCMSTIIA